MTNPSIVLDGDTSPFRRALRDAAGDLMKFGKDGEKSFEGMSSSLGKMAGKFTLVAAGIATFVAAGRNALGISAEWTEGAIDLGNALGISATAAGNLGAALAKEGVTTGEFVSAAQKLSANVKENESSLNAMGLATRDAAGNLRPLNEMTVDAIELVGKYKAGTDRAMAANELFGKGFQITGNLAKINSGLIAEVTKEQERLGNQVSQESVAAFEQYDESMKGVSSTIQAFWMRIGTSLMPVLADLGNWFNFVGPLAIQVVNGALGGLLTVFHSVTTGVTILWETINAMVVSVAEPIRALAAAISKAVTGDFDGAAEEIKGVGKVISGAWGTAFDEMAAKAQSTNDRISAIFSSGTPTVAGNAGGKKANDLVKPKAKDKKEGAEKTDMPEYEAKLAALRMAASDENALREYSKAEELAYWNSVLQMADVTAKDRMAIEKKVTDLTLAVRRDAIQQGMAISAEEVRRSEALALARVDAEAAAVDAAKVNKEITLTEALAAEQEFEDRRYQIKLAALEANLRLAELDPNTSPVELSRIHGEIEQLELQHRAKRSQMGGQMRLAEKDAAQESLQIWQDLGNQMGSLWDKGINAMMNGTFKWRNAFRAVGTELVRWFAVNVVGKNVQAWLFGETTKTGATQTGVMVRLAAESWAAIKSIAIWAGAAIANIATSAWQAMAATWAAISGIPYVGPFLAPVMAAGAFAAVVGIAGKVKSAEDGYDVPAGLNPMTQLHEEEMVLPKEHANTIRALANNEGQGGGGSGGVVNIYPKSGRWTRADVDQNKRLIAEGLSELYGSGWRPGQ